MLAIYTRLSREDEASNSIVNQQREGKAFANSKQLKYTLYNEGEGASGGALIEDRPKLSMLMTDIKNGKITAVWFRDQDRLERSGLTFALFSDLAETFNIKIYFNDTLFDYKDPDHKLYSGFKSLINENIRLRQSSKTKRALLDNIKEGKAHGIPPYGYKKGRDSKLEIDEGEAEIVKTIFLLSLEGKGASTIAETLNNSNTPTRYHKYDGSITLPNKKKVAKKSVKWAGGTVRGIIINPIYKGERQWANELFSCPAIIDSDYWQKVNDNLKKNANNTGKKVEYRYLLKGLLKCGRCGRNYYGRSRESKKDHYYMCSSKRKGQENCGNKSINIDFIENLIWSHFIADGNFQSCVINHFKDLKESSALTSLDDDIQICQTSLNKLKTKSNNIIDAISEGIIDKGEASSKMNSFRIQINDEERKLSKLKKQKESYLMSEENELNILNDLGIKTKEYSFADQQELLKKHVDLIKVFFDEEKHQYRIQLFPKLIGMNSIQFIAPYSKTHALGMYSANSEAKPILTVFNPDNLLQISESIYEEKKVFTLRELLTKHSNESANVKDIDSKL